MEKTTANRAFLTAAVIGGLLAGCNGDPSGDFISDSSPIAALEISGLTSTFTVGDSTRYTVTPLDSLGNALSGYAAHWSSSKPAVATVGSNGEVRALAAGTAFIKVRVVHKADSVRVTVVDHP